MYRLLRPILFALDPEVAHKLSLHCLQWIPSVLNRQCKTDKAITVMGLNFANPVGLAAGLDKNGQHLDSLSKLGFGFIEVGTVTPRPQAGQKKPRLFRVPSMAALVNRMGFNNQGMSQVVTNIQQSKCYQQKTLLLGVNIGKNATTSLSHAAKDYCTVLRQVYSVADYVTVNISSPNTKNLRVLQLGDNLTNLLTQIKDQQKQCSDIYGRYVPIAVKISPELADEQLYFLLDLLVKLEFDGIITTNTLAVPTVGGLSGCPLREASLAMLSTVSQHLKGQLPIISVGGIDSPQEARERLLQGAKLVQLYTALVYQGPSLVRNIVKRL